MTNEKNLPNPNGHVLGRIIKGVELIYKQLQQLQQDVAGLRSQRSLGFVKGYRFMPVKDNKFAFLTQNEVGKTVPEYLDADTVWVRFNYVKIIESTRKNKQVEKVWFYCESIPDNLKIESGMDTWFTKGLLQALYVLQQQRGGAAGKVIKIQLRPGEETCFVSVYDEDNNWIDNRETVKDKETGEILETRQFPSVPEMINVISPQKK